ncbi:hypothetical protein [Paracoccus sp. SY]|uniref:hypothetical protein n=1 Tax=Paracoccus sp. SY TaxID=1330255 RepID=UPI000CD2CC09|nr:hypothetical protein [Paracoccus sp. SY]
MATILPPVIRFFPHMGFRPAVQVVQRDQYGDKLLWIVGDDSPLDGKVPAELVGYAWGTVLPGEPAPVVPQITAASLAGPVPGLTFTSITPGGFPLFPPIIDCCDGKTPPGTVVVVVPPVEQPTPVGILADSGSLLLAAIAILFARKAWASLPSTKGF